MEQVFLTGAFDDLRSHHVRFLHEASRRGLLSVGLWSDDVVRALLGKTPKFPEKERYYLLQAIRFIDRLEIIRDLADPNAIPALEGISPEIWALHEKDDTPEKRKYCKENGIVCRHISSKELAGFPEFSTLTPSENNSPKKVVVTGCFDWFHSGHVRFFEEVSALGDLYVVVGSDQNVRFLKGEGHPMFSQQERQYVVSSVRYVTQALVSTGHGRMDAEPEIASIRPDLYVVNEDGDKSEKRRFCTEYGIEYVVLKRTPKTGLPRRESTILRQAGG